MNSRRNIWLMAVVVMMLTGCRDYDADVVVSDEPVSVQLAFSIITPATTHQTRQVADVVASEDKNPRLPYYLRFIPLVNNDPFPTEINMENPVSKGNPRSRFYYSQYCNLGVGVNGFIVYSNVENKTAPDGVNPKVYNGSLKEQIPTTILTIDDYQKDISFSLEPIYKKSDYESTNGIPTGAQALADCLTAIAKAGNDVVGYFHTSTDASIHFNRFTNDGNHLPGSAASVKKWISSFQNSISKSLNPSNPSILDAVNEKATEQLEAIKSLTYPRDIDLPDGAAVLRWDSNTNKFVPQIKATTIDNINSMARFAYPSSLYYYISSAIKTSDEKFDFAAEYSKGTITAWNQIVENSNFNKTSVSVNTKAVVLTQPLQYAVAQLKVKIKAYDETLKDAENKDVTMGATSFPLTGIIVCDQRQVDYKFVPKEVEQGAVSDAEVLFIYDNQVKTNCYLNPQSEGTWAEGCNTLVLQSLKGEDVNIILEFENNSDSQFTCIDGIVYPGTRFYLIGRVEASLYNTSDGNAKEENKGQVFTKDYITTVNMTVSSLARAYNVPPNLLSPNLEIGVETTPQWEGVTPTVIRLE